MTEDLEVDRRRLALAQRLELVQQRIADAGGTDVALLPVSKGHTVESALAAAQLGVTMLGENYAQELDQKARVLHDQQLPMQWHFIGQLQTNKVRLIADRVHTWQSVDRLKVAREIAKRAPGARVYAQVNLSDATQKAGCSFDDLDQLVDEMHALELTVEGLMGVGAADDKTASMNGFVRLRSAVDRLGLKECSMGMSADLEPAIEAGSTMVRIGSDLFGPRE